MNPMMVKSGTAVSAADYIDLLTERAAMIAASERLLAVGLALESALRP